MATAPTEIKVTPEIAAEHGVTRDEYARIQKILGRDPNITELGIFSVMWSEHCSYKSSKVHLKRLPTKGKLVVQGPGENAGVVDIGDGLVAAFKIESHNHPSYVEPFQGATTGVGGILRDIFTMGARPIAVLDSLRFGEIVARFFRLPARHRRSALATELRLRSQRPIAESWTELFAGLRITATASAFPRSAAKSPSNPAIRKIPWSTRSLSASPARKTSSSPKPRASAIRSSTSAQKPDATASTAPRSSPPPNSPKSPSRSAPTCRSAIPSSKNFFSKPASKP